MPTIRFKSLAREFVLFLGQFVQTIEFGKVSIVDSSITGGSRRGKLGVYLSQQIIGGLREFLGGLQTLRGVVKGRFVALQKILGLFAGLFELLNFFFHVVKREGVVGVCCGRLTFGRSLVVRPCCRRIRWRLLSVRLVSVLCSYSYSLRRGSSPSSSATRCCVCACTLPMRSV